MPLPSAIQLVQVNIGAATDFTGTVVQGGFVTFTPTTGLVWLADGTPLFARPITVQLDEFGTGSVVLPATDQPGFVDGSGKAVVNFAYKVAWSFKDRTITPPPAYLVQLPAATPILDLDTLTPVTGSGNTTVAVPVVTSVNGQTGAVTVTGGGSSGPADWSTLTNKPASFPSDWSTTAGKPTTFAPTIGTTATTAKAGNWVPAAADITDASTVGRSVLKAADALTARTALGITAPAAADITDATAVGRSVLKAADAAAARTAIGAGVPQVPTAAADITDATALGRSLLKAADATSARALIGAGTPSATLLVLGPADPVPAGTATGTVIVRTAS